VIAAAVVLLIIIMNFENMSIQIPPYNYIPHDQVFPLLEKLPNQLQSQPGSSKKQNN